MTIRPEAGLEWVAYVDLDTANSDTNTPNVTRENYQQSSGRLLLDFENGLQVRTEVAGSTEGGFAQGGNGAGFAAGTDAAEMFNDIIDPVGLNELQAPSWRGIITFTHALPDRTYRVALSANRGDARYRNQRFTRVTLVGADSYTNASTPGVVVNSEASVSLSTGDNTDNGYVARWVDIRTSNKSFSIVSEWDDTLGSGGANTKAYAMAYLKIEEWAPEADACDVDADCDDDNICTDDRCDLKNHRCTHPNNGAACDDGVDCTDEDQCSQGTCWGRRIHTRCGDDAECDDGNLCTLDVCNVETGQCESSPQAVPCDDEIACTVEDMCQGDGSCAGTPDHGLCDDANVCTDDVCEFGLGCDNPHNAAPCDDGVACTDNDVCAGGECRGLASCPAGEICDVDSGQCVFEPECVIDTDCDDGNDCTDNVCDMRSGLCVTSVNQSPCDDGVGCTDGDTCHDGACQGGAANHDACDDGNVCTDDVCETDTGCTHSHNVDPCDDGAGCTDNDTCVEGLCAGHDTCPEDLLCDLERGACRPQTQPVLFRAYNDLAWREGQILHNITHITTPGSFLPASGELVDYASGAPTGVTLAVAGGRYDPNMHGRDGRPAPAGTDAGDLFGGIVDTLGALTYVASYGSPLILTFSGLDPEGNYAVAFHGDRGSYGWDRASRVTLVGAETFINESSAAQDNPAPDSGGALFSDADDASTRLPANNPNGYVARFVEIRPDDNGEIVLLIEPDGNAGARGKYANAVMLEQRSKGCQADADCDDANACTDDACNLGPATCVHTPNQAVCDDGIACTVADQCLDGVCVGAAPEDAHCDDDNICTADACEIGLGCVHQNVAGPCDDNSACTGNDTCADGICMGDDTMIRPCRAAISAKPPTPTLCSVASCLCTARSSLTPPTGRMS